MIETTALRDAVAANVPLRDELPGHDDSTTGRLAADVVPFVGRRRELETVRRAWSRAARRFGGTIVLCGDAGIGKTRFCAEVAAVAEAQGGRTVSGATTDPECGPYQGLIAAARAALPGLPRDGFDDIWAAALAEIVPEIRAVRPGLAEAAPLEFAAARARLHEAFARFFEAVARSRPTILMLEDAHWAGPESIDALEAIARRASGAPLLVIATYRNDDVGYAHPVRAFARTLQNERRATRIVLGPLDDSDISGMIAGDPALQAAPVALAAAVTRVSEGNPLFALQLLREYRDTGVVPDESGTIHTVTDAIIAHIDRLDSPVRAVADAASTIGREFSLELAAAAAGQSETAVQTALEVLIERQLVRDAGSENWTYSFTHALVASTIYGATRPEHRPARHRRIARVLESMGTNDSGAAGRLARHWRAAGERDFAYAAFMRGAELSYATHACSETLEYARSAASLAADDRTRHDALVLALLAQELLGDDGGWLADIDAIEAAAATLGDGERFTALRCRFAYEMSIVGPRLQQTVDEMLALAERSGDSAQRVIALESAGNLLILRGDIGAAESTLRAALDANATTGDNYAAIRIGQKFLTLLVRKGDISGGERELEGLLELVEAHGRDMDRLHVLTAQTVQAVVFEDPALAQRAGAALLEVADRVGDLAAAAKAHATLGYAAVQRGDARTMRSEYDYAIRMFEDLRSPHPLCVTLVNRGSLELEFGRIDDALAFWQRAEPIAEQIGSRDGVIACTSNRAEALLLAARPEAAREIARRSVELARGIGEVRLVADGLVLLGAAECRLNRHSDGLRNLHEGIAIRRTSGAQRSFVDDLTFLVEALTGAGDRDAAREAAVELEACDPAAARFPPRVFSILMSEADARGDRRLALRHQAKGRALLVSRLRDLESADQRAYRALAFSRNLECDLDATSPCGKQREA